MQTSLRLGGSESRSLKIHAKEKIPLSSSFLLQGHGEVDTATASPSYLALLFRHFNPELEASLGVGVHLNKDDKLRYSIRGKKDFPLRNNHPLSINVKGRCYFDKDLKKSKAISRLELTWNIFNFQKEQDVRVKLGYDVGDQVPYFQIRENNWTLNADITGKWNVRYDL